MKVMYLPAEILEALRPLAQEFADTNGLAISEVEVHVMFSKRDAPIEEQQPTVLVDSKLKETI